MSGIGQPATGSPSDHASVMLGEVIAALAPRDDGYYVDGTFGVGGTSHAVLKAADCRVLGIDRDPEAVTHGRALATAFPGRLDVTAGRFSEMEHLLPADGPDKVDGVTLDLGVASPQLDQPERGFSFRHDGPLNMRMDGDISPDSRTAATLVNSLPESELARILRVYGEERRARQIARAIAVARQDKPITRTLELADLVRKVVRRGADGRDPATRTFQALRIAVNEEDLELERGLAAAERLLAPGGRLAVIAFHSLEDRAVKRFLGLRSGAGGQGSRHRPTAAKPAPSFELLFRGAQRPGSAEIERNPRARSARLRAAERTAAAPWTEHPIGGTA